MSSSVETVKQLQKYIEKNIALERKVMKALDTLKSMTIDLDVLQATGIGRYVNSLKHADQLSEAVIEKAKALVMKWKAAVQSKDDGRNATKEDHAKKASDGSAKKAASAIVSVTVEETRKSSHSREGRSYMEQVPDAVQLSKRDDGSKKRSADNDNVRECHGAKRLCTGEAEKVHSNRSFEEKPGRVSAVAPPEKRKAAAGDSAAMSTTGLSTSSSSKLSKNLDSSSSRSHHRNNDNADVVVPAFPGTKSEVVRAPAIAADGRGGRVSATRPAISDSITEPEKKHSQQSLPTKSQPSAGRRSSTSSGDGYCSDRVGSGSDRVGSGSDRLGSSAAKRKRSADVVSDEFDASDDDNERPKGAQTFEEMLAYDAEVLAKKSSQRKKKPKTTRLSAGKSPAPGVKSGNLVKGGAGGAAVAEELDRSRRRESSSKGDVRATDNAAIAGTSSSLRAPSSARDKSAYEYSRPSQSDGGILVPPPPQPINRLNISTADIISSLPEMSTDYRPAASTKKSAWGKGENQALEQFEPGSKQHSHTQVYSGRKQRTTEVSSLFDLSMRVLMNNIDSIGYVGHVPCTILMPVLNKCTSRQLLVIEYYNPVFVAETGELWKKHCQRDFAGQEPEEFESWREMYQRLQEAQQRRVEEIAARVSAANKLKAPERKTKLAYMDSIAKPPREVRRMQQKLGTASGAATVVRTPATVSTLAAGRSSASNGSTSSVRGDVPRPAPSAAAPPAAVTLARPKAPVRTVAPLMKQVLKFAKGSKR